MRIAEIGGESLKLGRLDWWESFLLERFLKSLKRIIATDQAVDFRNAGLTEKKIKYMCT